MNQPTLFDQVKGPNASQQECLEALRFLVVAGDTHDIQRVLREHGIVRERNCIAKRLTELERMGLVERVGFTYGRRRRTTWRRK